MNRDYLPVWIEDNEDGSALAFALDSLCAVAGGESSDAALDNLRREVVATGSWLDSHRLAHPTPMVSHLHVVERVTTSGCAARGRSVAFFEWDAAPVENTEIDRAVAILDASRSDLTKVVTHVPAHSLDIRLAPRSRTINEILRHIASMELWLTGRTLDDPRRGPTIYDFDPDVLGRLTGVRAQVVGRFVRDLRLMSPARRARQQTHEHELWTARKVLRMLVWHEVYHLKQVYRLARRIERLPERVRRAAVA